MGFAVTKMITASNPTPRPPRSKSGQPQAQTRKRKTEFLDLDKAADVINLARKFLARRSALQAFSVAYYPPSSETQAPAGNTVKYQ